MKSYWIKFGCFLTGYNYNILAKCSEVASKSVKKYTAAMLIICIIWAFVGFTFTHRYLGAQLIGSIIGSLIMVIIIVQVERQIILTVHRNIPLSIVRILLGLLMAIIGSLIIDQILFKDDIDQKKILVIDEKINQILPSKTAELRSQINQLDSAIAIKELERKNLVEDVSKYPMTKVFSASTVTIPVEQKQIDSTNKQISVTELRRATNTNISSIPNPKIALITGVDKYIFDLRTQKASKDSTMLLLRPALEKEIKSKVGFLDELKVMFSMLTESTVVLIVWAIWISFLLFLELLVLFAKMLDKDNDYDEIIKHQMNLHKRKIELLGADMKFDTT